MWIFLSNGTLMPALLPKAVLDAGRTPDIVEARERGWELQVRGRVRDHLEDFATRFMTPGSYSDIVASPDKDYNFRFYTTRADFGDGLAQAALEMDYTKFKDTAKESKYHSLLMKIWSASTMLAPAGGFYGPRSKDNPRGYGKAHKRGNPRKPGRGQTGSSFFDVGDEPPFRSALYDDVQQLGDEFDEDGYYVQPTRKSIHDLTDRELLEMWNGEN